MKRVPFALLKYLALLCILIFTAANLFYNIPDQLNLLILQIVFGTIYIGACIGEFSRQLAKSELPYERFFYLPFMIISSKLIKVGAYSVACCILFLSNTNLIFLAGLLLIIIFADIIVFALRIKQKVYYVSLFANYISFVLEEEKSVYAAHIRIIEYRYGIFYLQMQNGKVYNIEVDRIEKKQQTAFIEKFVLWVVCNKLHFTDEAREKLADIIATAI